MDGAEGLVARVQLAMDRVARLRLLAENERHLWALQTHKPYAAISERRPVVLPSEVNPAEHYKNMMALLAGADALEKRAEGWK